MKTVKTHREPTMFEKDMMLAFFKHHMTPEMRAEMMATMPAAYNALVGAEIAVVRNVHHDVVVLAKADREAA